MTNLEIQKAYIGNTEVDKIYLGAELIYSAGTGPTPIVGTPLTFEVLSAGTIGWEKHNTNVDIECSTDNGQTWSTFTSLNVNAGDTVQFRGNGRTATGNSTGDYACFTSTGAVFNASGNLYSLLDSTNYDSIDSLATYGNYTFLGLFRGNTGIRSAAFDLPATTLASSCYYSMFYGCTSLTGVPSDFLPATNLTANCYGLMFIGCTSLTSIPNLPSTTLKGACYMKMFAGCTSLTGVPSDYLPATTLANECYYGMFSGCTALTTAPDLPATTLRIGSYYSMFYGCSNLNYIKCLAVDISATSCTSNWVKNVASAGTFVKSSAMTSWTTGVDGIPSGWTVQNA